jgi:hypothetical protein
MGPGSAEQRYALHRVRDTILVSSSFPEPTRLFTVIDSALLSINFSLFSTRNATSIFMLSAKVE